MMFHSTPPSKTRAAARAVYAAIPPAEEKLHGLQIRGDALVVYNYLARRAKKLGRYATQDELARAVNIALAAKEEERSRRAAGGEGGPQ